MWSPDEHEISGYFSKTSFLCLNFYILQAVFIVNISRRVNFLHIHFNWSIRCTLLCFIPYSWNLHLFKGLDLGICGAVNGQD